ncbi:MAG: cyclic-di-AMP receptor [Dehalococcoidia bacterium]|nr:cyclic-di-AMP receptor [Dehalococcoidia bacterium]
MAKNDLKLVVMIVSDQDADRLIRRLVERGYPATKLGSSGGFLRRGSVTIFSGVEEGEVDSLLALVREECHAHEEYVAVRNLPFLGEGGVFADPMPVRVSGAIVFVLNVERFEKT